MPDMEKVTYDIERCICRVPDACRDCSHYQDDRLDCMEKLLADALSLLKEQGAVEPITEHHLFLCPMCKNTLFRDQKYCHECGKRIEWENR